jgi:protease-4
MGTRGCVRLRDRLTVRFSLLLGLAPLMLVGCRTHPIMGNFHTDSHVGGSMGVSGKFEVKMPAASDAGPVVPVVIKPGAGGPQSTRVAVLDVDGLILNQSFSGSGSVGENPVSAFKEKLDAAACDPRVRAIVVRINSPGGGVAASDLMAEELARFRQRSGKPAVASLLDVATGGGYYLAVGCDRIVALPTTVTGGVGALINHERLQGATAYFSAGHETLKSGDLIDMGDVTAVQENDLKEPTRTLFLEMAKGFHDRFINRVNTCRPAIRRSNPKDWTDGRIVDATKARAIHMIDALGYPEDAVAEAERLAGSPGSEVVIFQRADYPVRSIYATVPNTPTPIAAFPFSVPALDRSKLPTFLYLWQPDPTITRIGSQYQ